MQVIEDHSEQDQFAFNRLKQLQYALTLASLSIVVLTAGLPIYSTEVGASGLEIGLLYSAGALMTAVARPIIGRLIDLHGRRPFLVLGVAILVVAMLLFAAARDVTMLLIASTVQGFGMGTMLLSAYAMTADLTVVQGRGSSFGGTEQAQYRGGLYGGLIAIPVLFLTGFNPEGQLRVTTTMWGVLFTIYAVAAVIALVMVWTGTRETYSAIVRPQTAVAPSDQSRINPQLYVLMAIVALTSASASGIAPFILKYIQDHITQDVSMIALAYLPASLVWGFLPSKMGVLADRYGRKLPMAIGLAVSGVFSMFIPFMTTIFPLTVFATVEAVCYSAAVPAEQALVADMTGGRRRGMGFGLYTLAMSIGRVIGPLVMGIMYDQYRSGPFFVNAVILVAGTFLVIFVLRDTWGRKHATNS